MCFYLFSVSMANYQLTYGMKQQAIIVAIRTKHSDVEIALFCLFFFFLKSTVQHTVRQVLKASSGDVSPLAKRRNYSRRLDRTNTPQFIQEVQNIIGMTPGIHTRAIGIDLRFSEDAIRNAMHDDISYTSYVTRKS